MPSEIRTLGDEERLEWLRLFRSENIGVKNFYTLLQLCGSAGEALRRAPEMSLKGGRKKPIRIHSRQEAERELQSCQRIGAKVIARCEPAYSRLLDKIKDAPPVITLLGNETLLNKETIAIVGARNASLNGCRFTEKLAEELGSTGITIASGLARGIDTGAHRGSLNSGTIAVVAGGIDSIYPPENKGLREEIIAKGAVVAELPFGTIPRGQNFPQRNRIISGLSLGTVVVEATFGSGSLITARMALEQNREVFAVPGSPLDPRCKGTNDLIRQGAVMVESANDVLETIVQLRNRYLNGLAEKEADNFASAKLHNIQDNELNYARPQLVEMLGATPIEIDEIIVRSGMSVSTVMTILLELELAGRLERHAGNKVSLVFTMEDVFQEAMF